MSQPPAGLPTCLKTGSGLSGSTWVIFILPKPLPPVINIRLNSSAAL